MLPINLKELLEAFEKEAIIAALKATNGNCARAAELLGMKRPTLVEKRRKYNLPMGRPGLREIETDEQKWNLP